MEKQMVKLKQVSGWNSVDARKKGVRIGRPEKRQKLVQGFGVELGLDQSAREDCLDL